MSMRSSDLDGDELANPEPAHDEQRATGAQQHETEAREEAFEALWVDAPLQQRHEEGQRRQDASRHASLGGEGADLALHARPLTHGGANVLQDLGEVATGVPVDVDGPDNPLQILVV